jgi:two-component system sensor kinase
LPRLLIAALIAMPVLGWLALRGQHAGWYGAGFGLGIVLAGATSVLAALIVLYARAAAAAEDRIRDLERQLAARTGELQDASKDLETLSYSVSHDLRAPLRAVDGYCAIISEDYADQLDEKGQLLLGVVRDSSLKMDRLIDDLLALLRAARQQIQVAQIDMAHLANQAWSEIGAAAAQGSVQFTVRPLPTARGDLALLKQVWLNLIANACKYSAKREHPIIEVGGEQRGAEAVYFVKDNGVGFDMQYVKKLFEAFQRLHSPSEFPGTAVGLAIVQRIVTRHGGRVWAQGKVDEGATFFFSLPAG